MTRLGFPKVYQKAPERSPKRTRDESKIESKSEANKSTKNGPPWAPRHAFIMDMRGPRCPLGVVRGGFSQTTKDLRLEI